MQVAATGNASPTLPAGVSLQAKSDEEKELIAWATGLVTAAASSGSPAATAAKAPGPSEEPSSPPSAGKNADFGSPRSPERVPALLHDSDSEGELTPRARLPSPLPRSPGGCMSSCSSSPANAAIPARRVLSAGLPSNLNLEPPRESPEPRARSESHSHPLLKEPSPTPTESSLEPQPILVRSRRHTPAHTIAYIPFPSSLSLRLQKPKRRVFALLPQEGGFLPHQQAPVSSIQGNPVHTKANREVDEAPDVPTPAWVDSGYAEEATIPQQQQQQTRPLRARADPGPESLSLSLRADDGLVPSGAVSFAKWGRREEVRQSARKLAEIMSFLDEVEQDAAVDKEASATAAAAATTAAAAAVAILPARAG